MFPSWRIAILLFSAGCLVLLLAPESAVQPEKAMVQRAIWALGPYPRSGGSNIDNLPLI